MNKHVVKVVGTHALIVGSITAAAVIVRDLVVLYVINDSRDENMH